MSARSLLKSRAICLLPLAWLVFCYLLYAFYVSQRTSRKAGLKACVRSAGIFMNGPTTWATS